jgi:hypothetical protein
MPGHSTDHCRSCNSEKLRPFNGEVAIHFPGLKGLKRPIVWVFPNLVVCLNCGFAELTVPEQELRVLATGNPVEGAVLSEDIARGKAG